MPSGHRKKITKACIKKMPNGHRKEFQKRCPFQKWFFKWCPTGIERNLASFNSFQVCWDVSILSDAQRAFQKEMSEWHRMEHRWWVPFQCISSILQIHPHWCTNSVYSKSWCHSQLGPLLTGCNNSVYSKSRRHWCTNSIYSKSTLIDAPTQYTPNLAITSNWAHHWPRYSC